MNPWVALQVSYRALSTNKARAILTTLGIIIGVPAVTHCPGRCTHAAIPRPRHTGAGTNAMPQSRSRKARAAIVVRRSQS